MTVFKICFVVMEVIYIPFFSSLCESLSVAEQKRNPGCSCNGDWKQ